MRTLDQDYDMEDEAGPGLGRGGYRSVESLGSAAAKPPAAEPQDLTLGMTALLGIFLVVVLICAVFFGFGYSTGRSLHGTKTATSSPAAGIAPAASDTASAGDPAAPARLATGTAPLAALQPASKPSAGAPLNGASAAQAWDSNPESASPSAKIQRSSQARSSVGAGGVEPESALTAPAQRAGSVPVAQAMTPSATPVFDGAKTAPPAGTFMVQIAAVARSSEAETLARALRTNGYAATVRTEPQDNFLHVQVGPFATRDAAKAMRARLQGNGYNAFLKP